MQVFQFSIENLAETIKRRRTKEVDIRLVVLKITAYGIESFWRIVVNAFPTLQNRLA